MFISNSVKILTYKRGGLKGQCHEIFDFSFFHESVSPKLLSIPLGQFRIFSKIRGDIRSRCRWYRWQIFRGIVDTGGKFATGVNNTRGTGGICHRCRWHWWCTLTCENLREFLKKIEMTVKLFSGVWGKVIHEKNLKQKILWHGPFQSFFRYLYSLKAKKGIWVSKLKGKRVTTWTARNRLYIYYALYCYCMTSVWKPNFVIILVQGKVL